MKKNLLICAIVLLSLTNIFAQSVEEPKNIEGVSSAVFPVSKTWESTYGVFKTDVDNFMDVNSWGNLNLNNLFTSLSYGDNGIEVGFAKKLKNSYLGLSFVGDLGFDFRTTKTTSTTDITGYPSSSTTTIKKWASYANDSGEVRTTNFALGALYGIGNWGYKASISYYADATDQYNKDSSTSDNKTTGTITDTKKWVLIPEFSVGTNIDVFHPYANIGLVFNKDTALTTDLADSANNIENDNDSTLLMFGLGSSMDLPSKGGFSHNVSLGTDFVFGFFKPYETDFDDDNDKTSMTVKYGAFGLNLAPAYGFNYTGSDKLAIGLNVGANILWGHASAKVSHATDSYTTNSKNGVGVLALTPSLAVALTYDVIPSKLSLKAAAKIGMPELGMDTTSSKSNSTVKFGDTENTLSTNEKETSWYGFSSDCYLDLNSGFTFNLTESLSFDATWNIVGKLFNGELGTTLSEGSVNLWSTLNKVLIHNVTLAISFKL